ncbi:CHAP domain-containing protein [Paenarthrobacter sp. FR1]|uniref:CHAP domain-containing protein n=1 Tax=Paenarthrobacter sp. FR1 TaxID=3439548 RepID=UPI003DA27EAE
MGSETPQPSTAQPTITASLVVLAFDRPKVTKTASPPAPAAHPGMSLSMFLAKYEGTCTILPGYTTAECMAIFSSYHYDAVLGRPYSSPGAKDLWPQEWAGYEKIPASQPAQPGDVVTWSGRYGSYQGGGYGHVAIFIRDNGNDTLNAFGQNPNAATALTLSKSRRPGDADDRAGAPL